MSDPLFIPFREVARALSRYVTIKRPDLDGKDCVFSIVDGGIQVEEHITFCPVSISVGPTIGTIAVPTVTLHPDPPEPEPKILPPLAYSRH